MNGAERTTDRGVARLLDVEASPEYLAEQMRRYAERQELRRPGTCSVVVFRVGAEWLALPTVVFAGIEPVRPVHSVPHRREGVVAGVVQVRGELLICVSLGAALRLGGAAPAGPRTRLAVLSRGGERFAFVADEIAGLQRFDPADLLPVPATLAHGPAAFTRGMLDAQGRSVGVLDDARLFQALNQRLA